MTVQELYAWAKSEGAEGLKLVVRDSDGSKTDCVAPMIGYYGDHYIVVVELYSIGE